MLQTAAAMHHGYSWYSSIVTHDYCKAPSPTLKGKNPFDQGIPYHKNHFAGKATSTCYL